MHLRRNLKFLDHQDLSPMRLALLAITEKFIPKTSEFGMFKQALPELQHLKHLVTMTYTDSEVLIATHELCKKSFFNSPGRELEQELIHFFKNLGIKNYFERDTQDNFLRKCEYYNLLPKRTEARKTDPWRYGV